MPNEFDRDRSSSRVRLAKNNVSSEVTVNFIIVFEWIKEFIYYIKCDRYLA